MFQALSPEPVVSPVTHPQEETAGKLSAQPPAQDAASFTQVLNSLLRPAVNSPPPLPPEEQSPEESLQQYSTSSSTIADRDNESDQNLCGIPSSAGNIGTDQEYAATLFATSVVA